MATTVSVVSNTVNNLKQGTDTNRNVSHTLKITNVGKHFCSFQFNEF